MKESYMLKAAVAGPAGFKKCVIEGVQHYTDQILSALDGYPDLDSPAVMAALKGVYESFKENNPEARELYKNIRRFLKEDVKKTYTSIEIDGAISRQDLMAELEKAGLYEILNSEDCDNAVPIALERAGYKKCDDGKWRKKEDKDEQNDESSSGADEVSLDS